MKKFFKLFAILFFVILLIGTLVFLWQKTRPKVVTYELHEITRDTISKEAIATGKIEPRDEILIKPQISGIISEVYCEAGQMVKTGDVIAKVKVIPEMGALNSAESRVNVAKINLEQSEREYNRVKKLHSNGVMTSEEFEKIETALKRAKEELINAKDNLEIVENGVSSRTAEISNTQIRATVTGMVLDVPIKVGNSVIQSNTFNDGTTIASIADLSDMLFVGKVDETEIGKLKENMPVVISIGALQKIKLNAILEYISPKASDEDGVVMFEIKAATSIPDSVFIRAGYSANASITTDLRENVLAISESAIEFENEVPFVHVLTSDSTATEQVFERKEIKLGLTNGMKVEIISGLDGTEKLRGNVKSDKKK